MTMYTQFSNTMGYLWSFIQNDEQTCSNWFNDARGNAAWNASEWAWQGLENVAHYTVVPYFIYKTIGWLFDKAPQPAQPQTQYSRFEYLSHIPLIRMGISLSLSQLLREKYLKENFWEYWEPMMVQFFRPFMHKIMPHIYDIFDTGDLEITLRGFIPGGKGTIFTWMRGGGDCSDWSGNTLPEKLAKNAFHFAEDIVNALEAGVNYTCEVLQKSHCLNDFWDNPKECGNSLYNLATIAAINTFSFTQELFWQASEKIAEDVFDNKVAPYLPFYTLNALAGATALVVGYKTAKYTKEVAGAWVDHYVKPPVNSIRNFITNNVSTTPNP